VSVEQDAIKLHKKNKGKIEIHSKVPLKTKKDLSLAYTPGVAAVAKEIANNKDQAYELTAKGNTVAIISDGTAVLGLGDVGPLAALPIMEGKSILFKEFAGLDGIPIVLNVTDIDAIVETVKAIAPSFGAINLEDISAPRCFEVERRLKEELDIPVMHDDQHGTAVVTVAALKNALKVVGKKLDEVRVVINGAGAAGIAIAKLLRCADIDSHICTPVREVLVVDSKGIIYEGREDLNKYKQEIASITNPYKRKGRLVEALLGADVFIGVSRKGLLSRDMVKLMADKPIVFALANPDPEITPSDAKKGGAAVYASGRSDYENQVNNVLAYPGIFKGALQARAKSITQEMLLAAAHAIAISVKNPTEKQIVPSILDHTITDAVAQAVAQVAKGEKLDLSALSTRTANTTPQEKTKNAGKTTKTTAKKQKTATAKKSAAKKASTKKTSVKEDTTAKKSTKKTAVKKKSNTKKTSTKKTVAKKAAVKKKATAKKPAKKTAVKKKSSTKKKSSKKKSSTKSTKKSATKKKETTKKSVKKTPKKKGGILKKIKIKR
jgi:malate dehydrogenase (oxaloacetate-decarboxylating)